MKTLLKDNVIQMLIVLVTVTFGYARFTAKTEALAESVSEFKLEQINNRKDILEIKGDIKTLLERTKKL